MDSRCAATFNSNLVAANQTFFIKIVFYDPLLSFYQPQIFASLKINNLDFSVLIFNTTIEDQQLYSDYIFQINLSTAKLSGSASFSLGLSAVINSPAVYSINSTLEFTLIIDPLSIINVPFNQSFKFLVLVFTLALIIFFSFFGFAIHLIDQKRGDVNQTKHTSLLAESLPIYDIETKIENGEQNINGEKDKERAVKTPSKKYESNRMTTNGSQNR